MKSRLSYKNWPVYLSAFFLFMTWIQNFPKPDELIEYTKFQTLLNYKIGFIQRGFVGTFLLPIKSLTWLHFTITFTVITLILVLTFMAFCVWILRGYLERSVSEYWILFLTFLPMTARSMFEKVHYGMFDALLISVLLINAWLLTTKKRGAIVVSTLLNVIAMLIHPVYAFLFYAGTFNLLLWLWWKTKKKNYLASAVVNTVIVIALLLYFNSGHPILFMPFENIESFITGRSAGTLGYEVAPMISLWFKSDLATIRDAFPKSFADFSLQEAIVLYALMLPVIAWVFQFWQRYYRCSGKPKIFWIFALSLVSVVPCHALMLDDGRWIAGPFWSQLVLLTSVLNYDASDDAREIFTELYHEKSEAYRWGLLLYLSVFAPVGVGTVNQSIYRILLATRTILNKVALIL